MPKKIPLSWCLKEAKHTLQHQVPFPAQHYLWNTQLGTQSMTTSIKHNSSWIQCIATISTVRSETTNWHKNPSVSCQPHRFNTWQQQRGKDKEKKNYQKHRSGITVMELFRNWPAQVQQEQQLQWIRLITVPASFFSKSQQLWASCFSISLCYFSLQVDCKRRSEIMNLFFPIWNFQSSRILKQSQKCCKWVSVLLGVDRV